jgi:very-short-patch-repair endonuclease
MGWLRALRFANERVLAEPDAVVDELRAALSMRGA